MFRLAVFAILILLCRSMFAQDIVVIDKPANLGQAIGVGAIDAYALRKQVDSLQEEVRRLTGENEALRAQLRSTPQPEPTPIKKTIAKIVSVPGCAACKLVKTWAPGLLLKRGMSVAQVDLDTPEPGAIYPYFEFCSDNACVRIMAPDVRTPIVQQWLLDQMRTKGIK